MNIQNFKKSWLTLCNNWSKRMPIYRARIRARTRATGPFLEIPEKPLVKLRPTYSVKLVFSYVVKGIKIKITATGPWTRQYFAFPPFSTPTSHVTYKKITEGKLAVAFLSVWGVFAFLQNVSSSFKGIRLNKKWREIFPLSLYWVCPKEVLLSFKCLQINTSQIAGFLTCSLSTFFNTRRKHWTNTEKDIWKGTQTFHLTSW